MSCEEDVAELKSVFLKLMEEYYDSDWETKIHHTRSAIVKEEVISKEDEAGPSKPKKPKKKEWVSTSFKHARYVRSPSWFLYRTSRYGIN